MRAGMIGLGKLGLPVAVAMATRGVEVKGYDVNPDRMSADPKPEMERGPNNEGHYNDWLKQVHQLGNLSFGTVQEVVEYARIVFVAVQTPHDRQYEGITPLPFTRKDFDYRYLRQAVNDVAKAADDLGKDTIVVVISTCLPGTMERQIEPLLNPHTTLVYNPYFIAMGTTMHDFLNPEDVIIGSRNHAARREVADFYTEIGVGPRRKMSIESAELAKVAYNTFISAKLSIVNVLAEICHKTGADVDEVTDFLKAATDRIISPKYMTAGMGDGGSCHPRDNIALSWLSQTLGLHYDLFESIMKEREEHARWLADILITEADACGRPIVIMGYAFKPETNLTVGSHALLVSEFLKIRNREFTLIDTHVEPADKIPGAAVYLIGCKHKEYAGTAFPVGSVVIDPWRYIKRQEGVKVIRIGEGR